MVPAPVAVEGRARFHGVDHEAVAGTGRDDGGLAGAGAARGRVGHLRREEGGLVGLGVEVVGGRGGGEERRWGGALGGEITWAQMLG